MHASMTKTKRQTNLWKRLTKVEILQYAIVCERQWKLRILDDLQVIFVLILCVSKVIFESFKFGLQHLTLQMKS